MIIAVTRLILLFISAFSPPFCIYYTSFLMYCQAFLFFY
nr:MAG TPA: hypothetical protein [Caudoviricetes sp.]